MDQPYQPPASKPPELADKEPKRPNVPALRFTVSAVWLAVLGLMKFERHCGSFGQALSKIPESKVPPLVRSLILEIPERRAVQGVMVVALIVWLLSYTRLHRLTLALAFGTLAFALMLATIAGYLATKSPP